MFSTVDEIKLWIEPQINPYRGPLFITRSLESPVGDNIITNGGFGLVNTGKKTPRYLPARLEKIPRRTQPRLERQNVRLSRPTRASCLRSERAD